MSFFPIQGINPSGGGVELRQNIDKWFEKPKDNARQIALFFAALKKFQEMDPLGKDGKLSYYQIAGIHGQPMQPWDGAPPPEEGGPGKDKSIQTGGYCTHKLSTFSTWHRPYLLLFEQRIWETMKEIIDDLSIGDEEKAEWYKAADTWRLPYWDWSTECVPEAVKMDKVNIDTPVFRTPVLVDNPLHKFRNPTGVPMGHSSMEVFKIPSHNDGKHGTYPWDRCVSTSRWGVRSKEHDPAETWVHGVVNDDKVELALQNHGWYDENEKPKPIPKPHGTLQAIVHRLLSVKFTSWEMFATNRYDQEKGKPAGEEFLSLEYVHNNVHNWAGGEWMQYKDEAGEGAGHMSDVDVSAFDPIFYLHHCNIDRLLAIWQKLNPKLWFNQPHPGEPKPSEPSDPLQPFHKDKEGSLWTSDACRDVTKLHYSYFELEKPGEGAIEAEQVDLLDGLRRSINEQYGSTRSNFLGDTNTTGPQDDYIVNVIYDPFVYDGAPYTIYFFLGNPEEGGATCIGSVYNFSSSRRSQEGSCANCQQQKANGTLAKALVPITGSLLSRAKSPHFTDIGSLDPDTVEKYLRKVLQWRVAIGGEIINATKDNVRGLMVFAMKGKAEYFDEDNKLPKFYGYEPIVPATEGKKNGLSHAGDCPAAPLRPAHPRES